MRTRCLQLSLASLEKLAFIKGVYETSYLPIFTLVFSILPRR